MPDSRWWTTISTAELLDLRQRLVEDVRVKFGNILEAELDDVVQHAFVVLFRRCQSVKPEEDGLYRYLKTVARNAAVDRLRTARRRRKHLQNLISQGTHNTSKGGTPQSPPDGLSEKSENIWEILCALGELDRLVIWCHVVEGRSIREIARDLDLNWHRVAGIVETVLRRMRREFGPPGVPPPRCV